MIELIEYTVNKIDNLIKEQLPESKYQFELHDLLTNTKHFRGYDEPFHWGSVYKLFVVAEIIKMAEEGLLNLDDELVLHKDIYKNGSGILKFFTHLNRLTFIDACKMVMATSDNLCADELLNVVGLERLNKLFEKADCKSSRLIVNLDTMVLNLFNGISTNSEASFFQSDLYFEHFEKRLSELLNDNYTIAQDINQCFHFVVGNYFNQKSQSIFKDIIWTSNIHTRISAYTFFSKFIFRGKTGALGFGTINSETSAIINKETLNVVGYLTISTKHNRKRNFQSNDTIGLIGLEIANLYEQLYQQTK